MTTWVAPRATGRGEQTWSIAAAHGLDAVRVTRTVTTPDAWILARFEASLAWLRRSDLGLSSEMPNAETPSGTMESANVALVATAHWGLETGWGASEYNFNPGGIHCSGASAECFLDSSDNEEFAAFNTLPAFFERYFALVSADPYTSAWDAARRGNANFLLRLWSAGYMCGPKSKREATQLVARVARVCSRTFTNLHSVLPVEAQFAATDNDVPNRCAPGSSGGAGGDRVSRGSSWALAAAGAALLFFSSKS